MRKFLALAFLAFPFWIPAASAYSLGDCSYSSANGSQIVGLVCPDAQSPVTVSGSALPNADPAALPWTYFPAVFHKDGVWFVSLSFVVTCVTWFFAVFLACVAFYHSSVVAFKTGYSFWKKRNNPS